MLAIILFAPAILHADDVLPYGQPPIDYHAPIEDGLAEQINRQLQSRERKLRFDDEYGYLPSLLEALGIPRESQLLVYSKSSVNQRLIGPETPRAIYFSDEAYVGRVPGAKDLEIALQDPRRGTLFYTLAQDATRIPQLERKSQCLTCHASANTAGVPGLTIQSNTTDDRGRLEQRRAIVTHETPFTDRGGGWFVTGDTTAAGAFSKLLASGGRQSPVSQDMSGLARTETDTGDSRPPLALEPTSDPVAHLVLAHQLHGQNLITRVHQESLLGVRSDTEDRLLRYLLFIDEPALPAPLSRESAYARWFESQGQRDSLGRSLRDFDLETRTFKYRLSYLVNTPAFAALPEDVKLRLFARLRSFLEGEDPAPEFAAIPKAERGVIRAVLEATNPDYAAFTRKSVPSGG